MSYQVLARKWRPQTFDQIVGQEHVTTTLSNALSGGRVAHAYLFTGPRGCGKTTMARLLAKALNCDEGPTATPCGTCPSCEGIAAGSFLDVLEIDAASNTGVDNIRELRENAQYQPTAGKKRIFIIDEVHMLSKGAFNALLKTLEEPPEHVHFIFATTEPVRIPRTILSRCQRFDFRLFTLEEISGRLAEICESEDKKVDAGAIELLASMAEGSMRDGLSLLDQALSVGNGELDAETIMSLFGLVGHDVYLRLNEAVLSHDSRAALDLIDELANAGHDLVEFARGLVGNFRDLLLLRLDPELAARIEKPESVKGELAAQAARFETQDLLDLTQRSADNFGRLERSPHPRWLLEAQVVEYARHESQVLLSEILGRLEGLGGGAASAGGDGGGASKTPGGRRAKGKTPKAQAAGAAPPPQAAASPQDDSTGRRRTSRSPAATVAASTQIDGETDGALGGAFTRFAALAKEKNMGVGTCLIEAAPCLQGDRLLLKFRPEHDFHRSNIDQPGVLGWLSDLVAECFGRRLTICPVTETPGLAEEGLRRQVQEMILPTAQQELDRRTRDNPDLGKLIEGLGGRIVDQD